MVHVRNPRAEDEGEWLRMRQALWPDCSDPEHRSDILEFLRADGSPQPASCGFSTGHIIACVAERENGALCGFLEAAIRPYAEGTEPRPVGYIEGWYVDPDVRRQGIGRALVEAAEAWRARRDAARWPPTPSSTTRSASRHTHGSGIARSSDWSISPGIWIESTGSHDTWQNESPQARRPVMPRQSSNGSSR